MPAAPKMVDYYSPAAGAVLQIPESEAQEMREGGYAVGADEAKTAYSASGPGGTLAAGLLGLAQGASFHAVDAIIPDSVRPLATELAKQHPLTHGATEFAGGLVPIVAATAATGALGGGLAAQAASRVATSAIGAGVETAIESSKTDSALTKERLFQSMGVGGVLAVFSEGAGYALERAVPTAQRAINRRLTTLVREGRYARVRQPAEPPPDMGGVFGENPPPEPTPQPPDITLARQKNQAIHDQARQDEIAGYADDAKVREKAAATAAKEAERAERASQVAAQKDKVAAQKEAMRLAKEASRLAKEADLSMKRAEKFMAKRGMKEYDSPDDMQIPTEEDSEYHEGWHKSEDGEAYAMNNSFKRQMADDDYEKATQKAVDAQNSQQTESLPPAEEEPINSPFNRPKPPPIPNVQRPLPAIPPPKEAHGPESLTDQWQFRESKPDFDKIGAEIDRKGPKPPRPPADTFQPYTGELPDAEPDLYDYQGRYRKVGPRPFPRTRSALNTVGNLASGAGLLGFMAGNPIGWKIGAGGYAARNVSRAIRGVDDLALTALNNHRRFNTFLETVIAPSAKRTGDVTRALLEDKTPSFVKNSIFGSDDSDGAYHASAAALPRIATDQNALNAYYDKTYGPLFHGQPNLYGNLVAQGTVATQYLHSQLPMDPRLPSLIPTPYNPPRSEKIAFLHKLQAISDPMSVLQHPTVEAVDAIQNVYPETLNLIRSQLLTQLSMRKTPLSPQQVKNISIVLGKPIDGTVSADYIASLQKTAAGAQAPAAPPSGPPGKPGPKPKKVTVSKNFANLTAPGSQQNEVENTQ